MDLQAEHSLMSQHNSATDATPAAVQAVIGVYCSGLSSFCFNRIRSFVWILQVIELIRIVVSSVRYIRLVK